MRSFAAAIRSEIGSTVPAPPDLSNFYTKAQSDARFEQFANKAVASGYAPLDAAGLVPTVHIPPLAINDTFVVASEAAMLGLTAQRGDMAIRTDTGRTYVLSAEPASTLANWKEVLAAGQVTSVNGKTGVVNLTATDVGAYTKAESDAKYSLIGHNHDASYVAIGRTIIAGAGLIGGGDLTADRTFNVGAGAGITVAADSVALDTVYADGRYSLIGHNHNASYLPIGTPIPPATHITSANGSVAIVESPTGTFDLAAAGGASGSVTVLRDEEFAPAAAATTVVLAQAPTDIHVVTRNGVAQSAAAGHYSLSGSTITFSDAFAAGERVTVVYSVGVSTAADVWTKAEADARFVNVPGDTMTGTLFVSPSTTESYGLVVANDRARASFQAATDTVIGRVGEEYAGAGMAISNNIRTTTASGGWARDDTSKQAAVLALGSSSTILNLSSVAAAGGANPATLVTRMQMSPSGQLALYSDSGSAALVTSTGGIRLHSVSKFYEAWMEAIGTHTNGFYWGLNAGGDWVLNRRNAGADQGATVTVSRANGTVTVVPAVAQTGLRIDMPANGYGIFITNTPGQTSSPAMWQAHGSGGTARAFSAGLYVQDAKSYGIGGFDNAGGGYVHLTNGISGGVGGPIYFYPYGGMCGPGADNSWTFGDSGHRWTQVWATSGVVSASFYGLKRDFCPLDPEECAEAVLETDWVSFEYKPPQPPAMLPVPEDATDEVREQFIANHAVNVANHNAIADAHAFARRQNGYVLQSYKHKTHELFGLSDRKHAIPNSDLAIVACALQQALREIADLKAKLAAS